MIYAKLNASCVLCTRVQGQSKRSDMSTTGKKGKADEKDKETDPFLLASLVRYKLSSYPYPVSLSLPAYVVSVKLWPGYHLINDVKWDMIETDHDVPGTLLQSFQAALIREFPAQETTHRTLLRSIVAYFKEIADTVIHFDKKRGPEALLKRCHGTIENACIAMNSLLAARMEGEQGVAAADQIRQARCFDPSRYPEDLVATVAKIAKAAGTSKATKRAAPPGVCEWCHETIVGDYSTHNKSCTSRVLVKGEPAGKKRKKVKGT